MVSVYVSFKYVRIWRWYQIQAHLVGPLPAQYHPVSRHRVTAGKDNVTCQNSSLYVAESGQVMEADTEDHDDGNKVVKYE